MATTNDSIQNNQQQELKPGGIQNLMKPYAKPTIQKKMADLKMTGGSGPHSQSTVMEAQGITVNPTESMKQYELASSKILEDTVNEDVEMTLK